MNKGFTHFKELKPETTTDFLKAKLNELGINVVENWLIVSKIGTHSMRLTIEGTKIGTNGKGANMEFAKASAYAEFFERFQNSILGHYRSINDSNLPFSYMHDEKYMNGEEILAQDNRIIDVIKERLGLCDDEGNAIIEFNQLYYDQYDNSKSGYLVYPFYSVRTEKLVYLPIFYLAPTYGSHGMCAGNTPEEALVQGISEVFERGLQYEIIKRRLTPPDVSEEYIRKFDYIYEMFQKVNSMKGYKVKIKDFSIERGVPCYGLLIIEENTGRYGVNVGCHPDPRIALERTFTESTQGQDVDEFSKSIQFTFEDRDVLTERNIVNMFSVARGLYPVEIFGTVPSYKFTEYPVIENQTNKDIFSKLISTISDMGLDLLIRDASTLDFPTFHVIIPDLSDVFEMNPFLVRLGNTRKYVTELIKEMNLIDTSNVDYVIMILDHYKYYQNSKSLESYHTRNDEFMYPAKDINLDIMYFLVTCFIFKREYGKAKKKLSIILNSRNLDEHNDCYSWYQTLKLYLDCMIEFGDHVKSVEFLNSFCSEEFLQRIDLYFKNPENCIIEQYPLDSKRDAISEKYQSLLYKLKKIEYKKNIDQFSLKNITKGGENDENC